MTIETSIALAIGLLAGAGGFAGIQRFWTRPRVYGRFEGWQVVRRDMYAFRKDEADEALRAQKLPTAYALASWENEGKRAAQDIEVAVQVPGTVVDYFTSPEQDDIAASWQYVREPDGEGDESEIRIKQPRLMPGAGTTLIVGYWPSDPKKKPESYMFLGDRRMQTKLSFRERLAPWLLLLTWAAMIVMIQITRGEFTTLDFVMLGLWGVLAIAAALIFFYVNRRPASVLSNLYV